jgi:hypothetical protein
VKKPNSTSVIWDFFGFEADKNGFAIDNGKPQCRTCYKEIACKRGNTTNLFKHLPLLFPPSPPATPQQHLKAFKLQLLDCKTCIMIYRISRYFFTVFIVGKNFSMAQHYLGPTGTELGGGRWRVWGSVLDPRKKENTILC